ncbi:Fe-S cluster assembly protein SufD [Natronomonas sp. LN261]|jgi:Fe-S cluster assembly protein SufD|uniref:Fe-S cluster assembly protein SufD n=1 Tax=Natronomonas sp. LN261 TaxID=2750669 RepID=UPI0015EF101F|nr:Fe-S cluster assembly protein SufD [Natronomonas sp. LN261]
MSTQIHASIDEATVRQISEELDEPEWLLETRLDALDALEDLAFPDVIQTPGRTWTNLEELDYDSLVDPLDAAEEKDQLGPDEADVLSFSEAVDEHGALLEEYFGSIVDPESNYLTALSTALFTTGTVIHVPEGVDAEDVTIRTTMNSRSLFNYTLVVAEESSSVTILERQETGDGDASEAPSGDGEAAGTAEGNRYYSGITEIAAHENSYVQFGNLQDLDETTYVYSLREADIDTYAAANWIECNVGSHLSKATVESHLNGDASESKIVGAFYGHNDQHFDIDARVWHNAEHTTADLVTRGVVDDVARSVYEGVQHVGADAWDTSSYQRENTLMLSDESEADASPKLIINNHDTEASHSATVGQVSAEDMFYMTSRGLGERLARNMLVEGFYVPVFEEIEVEELRDDLRSRIQDRLQSRE